MAVLRSSCSDAASARRSAHLRPLGELAGGALHLDGFNVLTTMEAAIGGTAVLLGRDVCIRDLAGVHGTFRKADKSRPAIAIVGEVLAGAGVSRCVWYLDRPVSNSGRLRAILLETAADRGWDWTVELPFNPDDLLAVSPHIVTTADSAILTAVTAGRT